MKIINVGRYTPEIYAPAFSKGFRALGHEVLDIKYDDYLFKQSNFISSLLNRIQDRYMIGFYLNKFNKDIIEAVNQFKPDFVFLYRCYYIYDSTIEQIRSLTMVMSYNNDDPFSGVPSKLFYKQHISNSKYCHVNFVYRKKNIDDYNKIGITNTRLLLPYYLTYNNYPIPNIKKDIPIAFVGHFENDGRDLLIKLMIESGIPVHVYGNKGWNESKYYSDIRQVLHNGVHGEGYNTLLNRINISLVFLSKINNDKYTRRCFEIPATKTVMLAQYTEELDELFPEGKCAEYFRNPEELITKCKLLLAHPEKVECIANNGYVQLKKIGGSEVDRCEYVTKVYEELKKSCL